MRQFIFGIKIVCICASLKNQKNILIKVKIYYEFSFAYTHVLDVASQCSPVELSHSPGILLQIMPFVFLNLH